VYVCMCVCVYVCIVCMCVCVYVCMWLDISPPPTVDSRSHPGPSGLGLPVRRQTRCRLAAPPLLRSPLSGSPASDGAAPGSPKFVWVRAVAATPAAGVEAAEGGAGTVAVLAVASPGMEPQWRPHDPATTPAVTAEAVVGGAGTMAVLAAATPGVEPRGRPLGPAAVPVAAPRADRPPHSGGGI